MMVFIEKIKKLLSHMPWNILVIAGIVWIGMEYSKNEGFIDGIKGAQAATHVAGYFDGVKATAKCYNAGIAPENRWNCVVKAYPLEGVLLLNGVDTEGSANEIEKAE